MTPDESPLLQIIRDAIRQRGPVTFRWFMEQALYHPEHGFYSSGRCAIGRDGDYFTNVSVGSLFGRLMSVQFVEIWELLGRPNEFTIVEQGAHDGTFASDALAFVQTNRPECFETLRYRIIEPFPILQSRQEAKLQTFGEKIEWEKSLGESKPFTGIHFSNELIDALPVHLLVGSKSFWEEKYVAYADEHFQFLNGPLSTSELAEQLANLPPPGSSNYETEVNLAALDWIELLSTKLERGLILVVDYGYSRDEFFAPERTAGTLQSFANQRAVFSPLLKAGETDITAHVNWTSLAERAEECGLRVAGFADQHHFITALATMLPNELEARERRALQTLLHPELLGRTFQFLALAKNIPADVRVSGFRFGRDPRVVLELDRSRRRSDSVNKEL